MGNIPRKTVATNSEDALWAQIEILFKQVEALGRASTLRNASVSGGTGVRMLGDTTEDGTPPNLRIWINPTDGTITAYDVVTGDPMVRMGRMLNTGPADYGIEVNTTGGWVQLGNQAVTWNQVTGKPVSYPSAPHTHSGSDISGAVANATNATNAGNANTAGTAAEASHAALADGSQYAFNNTVSGSQFYAVWVGNDGGYHLGRNTSSKRYKENIRPLPLDKGILNVQPVRFDRKPQLVPPPHGTQGPANYVEGNTDEFGVIAEQAHEWFPDGTQFYDGKIDGVRYELYGAALIPIVKQHEKTISDLKAAVATQADQIAELQAALGKG